VWRNYFLLDDNFSIVAKCGPNSHSDARQRAFTNSHSDARQRAFTNSHSDARQCAFTNSLSDADWHGYCDQPR
jgi:hypothetical protein